jgi:hypothetical protein
MILNTDFIIKSQNLLEFFNEFQICGFNFNDLLINIKRNELIMNKILTLFNINITLFNELLKIISSKYIVNDRHFIYCFEYNLILILHVKNNLNNWKILQSLIICHNNYKSIYNQFLRWTKKDIFKTAYENNIFKNVNIINEIHDVLIDATSINNKYGSENVRINPEYTKKNVTKMSVITTTNKFIIGITPFKLNKKKIIYNKNEKIINTFEHDSKNIQRTINNINKKIKINNLIGDGGYKTTVEIKSNNKIINIITPNRKNQINKLNNNEEKIKLKIRYRVENVFGSLSFNERIMLRKDRYLTTFMSWFYIGCLEHNIKNDIKQKIKL